MQGDRVSSKSKKLKSLPSTKGQGSKHAELSTPHPVTWAASPCSSPPCFISIHATPIKGLSGDLKGWLKVPSESELPLS